MSSLCDRANAVSSHHFIIFDVALLCLFIYSYQLHTADKDIAVTSGILYQLRPSAFSPRLSIHRGPHLVPSLTLALVAGGDHAWSLICAGTSFVPSCRSPSDL